MPTPKDARQELLEPYVQRVAAFLRARGDENRPITIPSGPAPLTLSAEERKAAWSVLCGPTADWTDPQAWIALGAGLHLAVGTVLESMSQTGRGGDCDEAERRLAAVRAAAASFTEALREAIAAMYASGRADEAARLSSFRNKLLDSLMLLRGAGANAPPPAREAVQAAPETALAHPPAQAESAGPATAAEGPPTPDPALAPYLRRAAAFLRARGNEDRPLAVMFGRRTLSVSASERRLLWRSLCEGQTPASDWQRLIPECLALRLAMLVSLDDLERPGRTPETEKADRRTLQTALGLASGLMDGFRVEIERSVNAGALDDAKTMSGVRNAFAATLVEARGALAREPGTVDSGSSGSDAPVGLGGAPAPALSNAASEGHIQVSRLEHLKPFLDRAANLLQMRGHEDRPLSIPVGARSWSLDAWERQVLWKVLCEEGPPPPEWSVLLAHGAATRLAAVLTLERLRKAGAAPEARVAAEADRAAVLRHASETLERMQTTVGALAADGQGGLAERLGKFKVKLAETIQSLARTR